MVTSEENIDFRAKFGEELRRTLKKLGVTHITLANRLGVTPGYVSHIISGRSALSDQAYETLIAFLQEVGSDDDVYGISESYHDAKFGKKVFASPAQKQANTLELHFLDLFRKLTEIQQMAILRAMLQSIEDNMQKMSENVASGK